MNISTVFLTLALMIASLASVDQVQAMDIKSYKNQALTSIRLELWYKGIKSVAKLEEKPVEKQVQMPEELTVALQKQLAH